MGGALHPKREEPLCYRDREGVTIKRHYGEEGKTVMLRLEKCEHEELVLPSEDVRVRGRVVYVVHPPDKRAAGGRV